MSESQQDEASPPVAAESLLPGQRLRQAREARGMSVQAVASNLRLGVKVIQALEDDDYSGLPATTFVTGYLRAYGRLLDLPEDSLSMPGKTGKEPPLVSSVVSASQPSSRDFPMRLVSIIIVLLLLASGVVWWLNHGHTLIFERQQNTSSEPLLPLDAPLSLPLEREVPASAPDPLPIELADETIPEAPPEPAREAAESISPRSDVSGQAEAASPAPMVLQAEVELRYSANSWTEVTDNNGERLAYGLVEDGTVLQLKGEAPFRIMLGYAPGVSIYFNNDLFDHSPFQRRDVARFRLGGPEHNHPVSR